MISRLKTPEEGERKSKKREYREWSRNTNKHTLLEAHPHQTHTQRKKTHPSSRARRGYSADPSLVLVLCRSIPRSQGSHWKIDQTTVSPWPSERPTPESIGPPWATLPWVDLSTVCAAHSHIKPPSEWPTPRSTHHVHVATTVTTTKSPTNPSLSLSLNLSLSLSLSLTIGLVILIFLFWFLFLWLFIYFDSL